MTSFPSNILKTALLRYNPYTIQQTHWKHTVQWCLVYSQCSPHDGQFWNIFITPRGNTMSSPFPLASMPPPAVLGDRSSLSVSIAVPVLGMSYQWNHRICGLWYWASFTEHNVFEVHLCCSRSQNFIFFSNWVIFCCMTVTHHLIHPIISWWTFGFLLFGNII